MSWIQTASYLPLQPTDLHRILLLGDSGPREMSFGVERRSHWKLPVYFGSSLYLLAMSGLNVPPK